MMQMHGFQPPPLPLHHHHHHPHGSAAAAAAAAAASASPSTAADPTTTLALMRSVRSLLHALAPVMAHQMDRTLNVFFDRAYFLTLLTHAPFVGAAVEYWRDVQHYLLRQSERAMPGARPIMQRRNRQAPSKARRRIRHDDGTFQEGRTTAAATAVDR
jgi:hypothetical protein